MFKHKCELYGKEKELLIYLRDYMKIFISVKPNDKKTIEEFRYLLNIVQDVLNNKEANIEDLTLKKKH